MERRVNLQAAADRLLAVASNPAKLAHAYSDFIQAIFEAPLWSAQQPNGVRIPWRSAKEARKHSLLRDAFDLPGLYVFGSDVGCPSTSA